MPDKIYVLFLFAFVIVLVVAYGTAWGVVQPIIKDFGNNKTVEAMNKLEPSSVNTWLDWAIILIYFALNILACVVLPLTVENNPVFFGILAFIMFLLIAPIALLANALIEFLEGFSPSYTLTIFLLKNIVILEVVFILVMIFILYFKGRNTQQYMG